MVDVLVVSVPIAIMMHLFRLAFLGLQKDQSVTKLRILSSVLTLLNASLQIMQVPHHSLPEQQTLSSYRGDYA